MKTRDHNKEYLKIEPKAQSAEFFSVCGKYMITCGTVVVPAGIAQSVRLVMDLNVRGSNPELGDIFPTRRGSTHPPAHLISSLFPGLKQPWPTVNHPLI